MFDSSSNFQKQVLKKRWLFQATDFQSLMYPCFIFCNILGIFPYKINASTFKISKLRFILSTIVICMVFTYEFMILYNFNISKEADVGDLPWTVGGPCYYIFSGFIAIVTYFLSNPRMHLLQIIMNVSSKLPSKMYKKLSKLIHTKDIFSFFFLIVVMIFYNKLAINIIEELYVIYLNLVVLQMDMLYFNCVCILKACFKRINDNLANLREPVVKDLPNLFSRIYHKQQGNSFLLMELRALKKQHLMISDTVQMLNLVFSVQILTTVIITFCEVTFSVYFYTSQGFTNKLRGDFWNSFFMVFIIYQVLKISSIVWICETGKNQALKIGTTIHDVFNSISDEDVKDELHLFSLQILQRKNIFSAKGFNVDARLLAAIVGNITTYVLILMQFLLMSNSCNAKSTQIYNITRIN